MSASTGKRRKAREAWVHWWDDGRIYACVHPWGEKCPGTKSGFRTRVREVPPPRKKRNGKKKEAK